MFELIDMMRPLNCLMGGFAAFIGGLLVVGSNVGGFYLPLLYAFFAVLVITGAGNVFNDYVDVEADKVNRPKRPIPAGKVSRRSSLAFSIILFLLGITAAGFINWIAFFIAVINSLVLIGYSFVLQHKLLLGNVSIGYLVGSTFLFGGASIGNIPLLVIPLILMMLAMLATIAREIVKDLEDMEGDRKSFLKRITMKVTESIGERFGLTKGGVRLKYGERTMIVIAVACLMLAIVFSYLPYYYGLMGVGYALIVGLADIVFLSSIYSLGRERKKRRGYRRISKRLKVGMFIALVAFIAGVFI
ncbi:MAG: digeranylgeranylglyceryl phosphate synthase [Candidatus Aenigmarchaeota archaeon]|nr:digeranylgeranylglyceryl phosphate synthase [Candidatus Aenigmarchaeota archaeon]NIP40357.1 digeranylgeranylglyceryl phosphate synthase [Candidatus Aenigmarchaeota archaeon]NIQ18283.1 digeranylgeranylglyceryl phosphate synthase [Candidatus Aenigmarchaeota archaeon]NIS73235.1 digeranylgeranylglyceryl phosphate synthase [Candidatus Aenigmarchaeota archaeon]